MAKAWKKIATVALATAIAVPTATVLAACGNKGSDLVTYRTYTTVMPSNWNELTYEDNNDTQILNYLVSSFYEYDYEFDEAKGGKFKEDGTVNADAIVEGGFSVKYSAATKLEDVTSTVDAKWGYTDTQKQTGGYAWKITLRDDLKWDDGTPIDASDFVYTMQQQLDPKFQNMRANTYYNNITIKNARYYVLSLDQKIYETITTLGYESNAAAQAAGLDVLLDMWGFYGMEGGVLVTSYNPDTDTAVLDENTECPQYVSITDERLWLDPVYYSDMETYEADMDAYEEAVAGGNNTATPPEKPVMGDYIVSAKDIYEAYAANFEVGGAYSTYIVAYVENKHYNLSFDDVGIYSPSKYEIVVCLDNPIQCLKEDGSLSYEAAYSFASLPLVKEDLYEACKQEPVTGTTLWTTNYNTSVATSASWGPYKLTEFQGGKSYKLERNENWYGYNLDDNANQYQIDVITCEQLADVNTQWLSFLAGNLDSIGIDVDHKEDYRNSKYAQYAPGTGTFGINLMANLDALNESGRNNSILAIPEFRKAISLSLDRDDYNATVYTSHQSCYGLLGPSYYYDVENGGVYRDTQAAKEALLRVYGFEYKDGKWTDGTNTYNDYESAYDAMNGYNPTEAKQLIEQAYTILTSNPDTYKYDASKPITLVYGTSADNANSRRGYDYIKNMLETMVQGTSLEGKLNVTFDASFGSKWADDFKDGAYDIAAGTGFSGGALDPAGFLQCYVDPYAGLMYSTWWNTAAEQFTYTMPEGDYAGAGEELTMSVLNWYCCLNGIAESYPVSEKYNWGAGFIPEEDRLQLLAALEELVLEQYFTVITTSEYSASVVSAKFDYISDDYNIFMGFGGVRYMTPNYNDGEWADFVASQNNDLATEYKKTN